jgi:hypothetical protein
MSFTPSINRQPLKTTYINTILFENVFFENNIHKHYSI